MITLRDYQKDCISQINAMKIGMRKIAYLATGAGKTIIMSEVAKNTTGRVLIVVDQFELRKQTIDKLIKVGVNKDEIGSVQGKFDDVDKRIVVATRQSLTHPKSDRFDRILNYGAFNTVMIDECHRAVSQVKKIIDLVANNTKVIGFTATPFNQQLKSIFTDFIYKKDIVSLIEEGYLCSPRCFTVSTNTDLSGVKTVGGEYVQSQLSDVVDNAERNAIIVKAYKDYVEDRKHCLVFATSIEHAENLTKTFNLNGISAKSVDSSDDSKEREDTIKEFKEGKFKVLVNVAILTTGFDFEELDAIIMARPTKSKILYTQCIGRGLRLAEGKEDCLIVDITDNVKSHSLLSTKSIFDIEDDETIKEAKERKKYEVEEKIREVEEQKRLDEELERIKLEEIDLFNRNIYNITEISSYDWFFNTVNNKSVAILSITPDRSIFIVKNDEKFIVYDYKKIKSFEYNLEELFEDSDLKEVIDEVHIFINRKSSRSFISKKSEWKFEEATEKQILACKNKNIKTKWDAHKFFAKRSSYFGLKDVI
ncbi:MAG: DEAD/DEAH box helicase [Clostridium sp.]|nr:DEAD/DEAH box helicase [Clostridium sp.]